MSEPVKLRNLGPVSMGWLAELGIRTRNNLRSVGSVGAYAMVCARQSAATMNLLWGLEAALQDIDWRELSDGSKQRLRKQPDELIS